MKHQDLTRLEAAMRDANPVPRPGDLVDSDESAAVAVLVRERTDTQSPGPGLDRSRRELAAPAPRQWVGAFAAGLAATVLVVGAVAVLRPGTSTGPDVADPSTTTSITTTTSIATTTPDAIPTEVTGLDTFVFPAADVPAFTATVVYDMNPLGEGNLIPSGATVTVRVLFAGADDYLYEVLSAAPEGDVMDAFGVPGLTILGAGDQAWIKEPGDGAPLPDINFRPAGVLLWNAGRPPWDEICSTGEFTPLGTEAVAGRATAHGRCSDLAEDYELWVDTSTGVVMKLQGALDVGDLRPTTTRAGGYEIVDFALGEVELPDAPSYPATPGAVQPLHMIHVEEYIDPPMSTTTEFWYQEDQTWIDKTIESTNDEFTAGSFVLRAEGRLRGCDEAGAFSGRWCWESDNPEALGPPVAAVPIEALNEHCDLVGAEQVEGRTADHYVCGVALWEGDWVPRGDMDPPAHHWIDQATSIQLRYESSNRRTWVSLLEVNPLFPAEIFDFVPLTGDGGCPLDDPACQFWSDTPLVRGEPAPTFTGPRLDGTTLQLEDLRGQPAVVFHWGYGSGDLGHLLDDFQALSEKWADDVGFLGTPQEPSDSAQRIVERGGYTFDNVACYEEGPAGMTFPCKPNDVMELWGIPWPTWIILDENGVVFDGFAGNTGTYEKLDATIEAVLDQ